MSKLILVVGDGRWTYQGREPVVHLDGRRVEIQVAETAADATRDDQCKPRSTSAVLHTQNRVDERRVGQGSQRPAGDVETGNATADHRQKDEAVDRVGQPVLLAPFQRNHKGAADGARPINEVLVVAGDTHADEPDVEDEEEKDAPKDGHDDRFDRLARLDGLARDDGDVLRRAETEGRLDKGLGEALHVGEGAGVPPVAELDGAVGRRHAARGHDEHVGDDDKDGEDLEPAGGVLDVAVHADGEHVGQGGDGEEQGDVAGQGDLLPAVPVLEDADGGGDLGGDDHDPLEPEVDALGEAQRWVDVLGGHADEAAVDGTVGGHLADGHVEGPYDETVMMHQKEKKTL